MQGKEVPEQITRRKDHNDLYDKKEHRWALIWRRHVAPSRRLELDFFSCPERTDYKAGPNACLTMGIPGKALELYKFA
jgi:hypothetical protein